MIGHFMKAVAQLDDPKLRHVLWLSILLSLVIFVALWIGLWALAAVLPLQSIPGVDWLMQTMGAAFDWLAGFLFVGMLLLFTLMLFPAVVTIIVGFFLDAVADAVEARHYPALPPARNISLSETVISTVRFALVTAAVNLIALPFYILLLFLPPMNLVLFYLVNGYLISREYFELVAWRRLDPATAARLRRSHRGRLQFAGILLALLMTIPIVNLLTPVVGTAFMVHVFHHLARRRGD
jgi:CysZ protein